MSGEIALPYRAWAALHGGVLCLVGAPLLGLPLVLLRPCVPVGL